MHERAAMQIIELIGNRVWLVNGSGIKYDAPDLFKTLINFLLK